MITGNNVNGLVCSQRTFVILMGFTLLPTETTVDDGLVNALLKKCHSLFSPNAISHDKCLAKPLGNQMNKCSSNWSAVIHQITIVRRQRIVIP